jgi:hypothetical protein
MGDNNNSDRSGGSARASLVSGSIMDLKVGGGQTI